MFRFWIFVSGVAALTAVAAAAWGAHGQSVLAADPRLASIFETAQRFHMVHAIALFALAALHAATDGRRNLWGAIMLNLAAIGFVIGIVLFSGGLYYQVMNAAQTGVSIAPVGGVGFMAGWAALSLSAFGFRRQSQPAN